jgi:nicotinamidase-related amidase
MVEGAEGGEIEAGAGAADESAATAGNGTAGGFFGLPLGRVAVIMVDFQNDFCSPGAWGGGPVTNTPNAQTAERANVFARHAAALGAHVVYTRQVLDMDRLTERQRRLERPDGLCAAGSWGAELFVPLVPRCSPGTTT